MFSGEVLMRTERLILRQWKDDDRQLFYDLNNDQNVMRYFPRNYTREESDLFIDENTDNISNNGWGCWAVETIDTAEFIGFVGLSQPADYHPCAANIDIGWRLKRSAWGNGYATEAAKGCLNFVSEQLKLKEIYSIASIPNVSSIAIMKKLGMQYHSNFQHPALLNNDNLKNCAVYYKQI